MASIPGECLCGAVKLTVARMPRSVTLCNCSVCRKYGTLWAYYARTAVTITAARGALAEFSRRPRGLRFIRCATCGCVVCWRRRREAPDQRMGVNARLLDQARMAAVPISVLDGDHSWRVLERYVKPDSWISPKRPAGG